MTIGQALTGTFAELGVLATLASCALYAAAGGMATGTQGCGSGRPARLNFRRLGAATAVGVASMLLGKAVELFSNKLLIHEIQVISSKQAPGSNVNSAQPPARSLQRSKLWAPRW